MAALLSSAFLAWAGVIWGAWSDVSQRLFGMSESMARVEVTVVETVRRMNEHERRPWHDDAGRAHSATQGQLDRLRDRVERLEGDVNGGGR